MTKLGTLNTFVTVGLFLSITAIDPILGLLVLVTIGIVYNQLK